MTDDSEEQHVAPLFHALGKLLTANAPYHPTERLIVLAIVMRMNRDGVCWPSLADIAKRTGLNRRTASKWLSRHLNGPAPLLSRRLVPEHPLADLSTRARPHHVCGASGPSAGRARPST